MTAPAIVAIRKVERNSRDGRNNIQAILTIQDGPWVVSGFALMVDAVGRHYLRPRAARTTRRAWC
ncbi:hypothetical protein ACFQU7_10820 [Pseudoroseomonas wenyumeiae]